MNHLLQLLPLTGFTAAVLAAGTVTGVYTDRWGRSPDRAASVARLSEVPDRIGPWVGEDQTLDPAEVRQAGVDGYLLRVYRHPARRQAVTMLVVCGRPGPVSAHTPDVCYQASGFTMTAAPVREPVGAAEMWTATMTRQAAVPEHLTVRWAWRPAGGGWLAPDRPRMALAHSGVVYKLYVLTADTTRGDSAHDFLSHALPLLDRALGEEAVL